ncbi:hypothetical protein CLV47_11528 [Antricoccus suffuscus]|uniref:LemA protein n=1 Tax=Antricoccus suffuscus TaxID=1629062 RepID=A0A2T0ZW68_9ACTN|nr:LemA family protein [Antricoccus suffuscus]PRZ40601.1 hypothetical protein CLV47_11528 [Antricoccus suffuscus]
MTWLFIGLAVLVLIAVWITWTAGRIDRLNARCDAAWARLDAQLVRRSSALRALAEQTPAHLGEDIAGGVREVVHVSMTAERESRAASENTISAYIADLPTAQRDPELTSELSDSCERVRIARTFYNDAVRATAALRGQWLARTLRLGRRTPVPPYFDINDVT